MRISILLLLLFPSLLLADGKKDLIYEMIEFHEPIETTKINFNEASIKSKQALLDNLVRMNCSKYSSDKTKETIQRLLKEVKESAVFEIDTNEYIQIIYNHYNENYSYTDLKATLTMLRSKEFELYTKTSNTLIPRVKEWGKAMQHIKLEYTQNILDQASEPGREELRNNIELLNKHKALTNSSSGTTKQQVAP